MQKFIFRIAHSILPLVVLALLLPSSTLTAREFTDIKGRKIEAEIVGATLDGQIEILKGGKKLMVPVNLFSIDDQDHIREWIKTHPDKLAYQFRFYADVDELRSQNKNRNGSQVTDKLKTKPQRMLINVTNTSPGKIGDIKIVADAVIEDAVNAIDGSYAKLAVGYKKKDVVRIQRIRAEAKFPTLAAKERAEIIFEFDIESYVDRDYGRVDGAAADRVLGAWIRVYKGEQMIGEYKRGFHSNFDKVKWEDENLTKPRNVKTSTK